MNRSILAVTALTLVSPGEAHAQQSCDTWQSGDDGTGQTMASICTGPADKRSELWVQCGGKDKLSIRYLPAGGEEPAVGSRIAVTWEASGEIITLTMLYEPGDGALAVYPSLSERIVALLKSANNVRAASPDGKYGPDQFTLAGSAKAIAAVEKSCP
jgi:hypothetical protein